MRHSKRIGLILILVFVAGLSGAEEGFDYPPEMGRDPFEALISPDGVININQK